jgi:hypothetical protein
MRVFRASVLLGAVAIFGMAAWTYVDRKHAAVAATEAGATSSPIAAGPSTPLRAGGEQGSTSTPDSLSRPFAAGGRISMDLSAGQYKIEGAPDDRIEIRWSVRDADRLRDVRVQADVRGTGASIATDGPSHNFRVAIRVPVRADLHVRLSAGELSLRGIEGHKDVELNAGELDIDVGRAEDYSDVDGSVWAGEIQAPPFRIAKGGLFRSFNWRGPGKYRLHARLMAGEVRLRATSPAPVER